MGRGESLFPPVRPLSSTELHHGAVQTLTVLVLCSHFSLKVTVVLDGELQGITQSLLEEFSTKAMRFSCSRRDFSQLSITRQFINANNEELFLQSMPSI